MILEPKETVLKLKARDKIRVCCDYCKSEYYAIKHLLFRRAINLNTIDIMYQTKNFCNMKCKNLASRTGQLYNCKQCSKPTYRIPSQKEKNVFCCHSCSAKYNNAHKTKGCRVSKLEKWLQIKLVSLYPNIHFHFNRKDAINSELDIYIPSLKLAFELNGIFHYEPIYGEEKLSEIKNNDDRKYQACIKNNIELCVIDTTSLKHFKLDKANMFLKIITDIIDIKLAPVPSLAEGQSL